MNLRRSFAMTKIILLAHVLNPLWWSREHRRARRCQILTSVLPNYFKRYLPAVDAVKETSVIKDDKNEKIFTLWLQGEDKAPPLVKACFKSIRKNCKQELMHKIIKIMVFMNPIIKYHRPPRRQ